MYVLQDPNTGDILAMSCMIRNADGSISASPTSIYTDAYAPGSVVKGATVYMGLDQGVIQPGEKILDNYIKIKDTPIKKSWKTLGWVDDVQALAQSSNVFMFNVAIRLGGGTYIENNPLQIDANTYLLMRSYYSQFGLGVLTGIDVPNEAVGYMPGKLANAGNTLDFAIGQLDNYTTIELAQYVSTIANGGKKIQPRLVRRAFDPGTQNVVYENYVNVMSTLENTAALDRVRQGFNACVYGGICYGLTDVPVTISAKTGTAESFINVTNEDGTTTRYDTTNNSVVAYAPAENPDYAMACMIPNAWVTGGGSQSNLCLRITNELTKAIYNPDDGAQNSETPSQPDSNPVVPTETPALPPTPDSNDPQTSPEPVQ